MRLAQRAIALTSDSRKVSVLPRDQKGRKIPQTLLAMTLKQPAVFYPVERPMDPQSVVYPMSLTPWPTMCAWPTGPTFEKLETAPTLSHACSFHFLILSLSRVSLSSIPSRIHRLICSHSPPSARADGSLRCGFEARIRSRWVFCLLAWIIGFHGILIFFAFVSGGGHWCKELESGGVLEGQIR